MAKKKKVVRTSKQAEMLHYGEEPKWKETPATQSQISSALNWYNRFFDDKQSYNAFFKHYPERKDRQREISLLKKIEPWRIPRTISHLFRMANQGCMLDADVLKKIDSMITELLALSLIEEQLNNQIEKKPAAKVVSIQDRMLEKSREYCAIIDDEFDKFYFDNKFKSDFKMYDWLRNNEVPSYAAQYIFETYQNMLEEYTNALNVAKDKDYEDLQEAYEHITKANMKKTVAFLQSIVDDCEQFKSNKTKTKKPRKKKAVSFEKKLSRFKYCKEFKDLKLVSISPEQIFGAKELWTYNTKYRVLTRYMSTAGLDVKGTTLLNFDLESESKKIRKPEEIIPNVLKAGKVDLRKLLKSINTNMTQPNGRINENTILLRVL